MKISVEKIDSFKARNYLESNTANRSVRQTHVEYLADQMKRGLFVSNGETIKIADDGRLLDGQHRLLAIVQANFCADFVVVRNLPNSVFSTIDTGKPRTTADCLNVMGEANYTKLAAAGTSLACWLKNNQFYSSVRMPSDDVFSALNQYPNVRDYVKYFSGGTSNANKLGGISSMAAVCAVFEKKYGSDLIHQFMQQFIDGENLSRGMPAYALRERFAGISRTNKIYTDVRVAMFAKALLYHCLNKPMKICKITPDESLKFYV